MGSLTVVSRAMTVVECLMQEVVDGWMGSVKEQIL